MINYLRFLFESEFSQHAFGKGGHEFHHHSEVGGHRVGVYFSHHPSELKHGEYSASFKVNNAMDHESSAVHGSDNKQKILHHVHRTIHHFIQHEKPKAIHMEPFDWDSSKEGKKASVYHKLAHHLAKHYGGTVHKSEGIDRAVSVHFNH